MNNPKVTYASSGVDINRQDEALRRIKPVVKQTRTPGVRSDIGLFGGLFSAQFPEKKPILVASTDGVGTKMKVARRANQWNTVGADLVNHCINDILVQGARPLFFMDYIAAERLEPATIEAIVQGMGVACQAAQCAILGGELAEMPGVYEKGEVDVAGTIVGVVDEDALLPATGAMKAGDCLIALPSSGLHTNGYSLARKVCFEIANLDIQDTFPGTQQTVAEVLLAVHRSYLSTIMPLVEAKRLLAMAHITGGGLTDNIPRVLPDHLNASIDPKSWEIPALFRFLMEKSQTSLTDARQALNLGVGMVLVVAQDQAQAVLAQLQAGGEKAWIIGQLTAGNGRVDYV